MAARLAETPLQLVLHLNQTSEVAGGANLQTKCSRKWGRIFSPLRQITVKVHCFGVEGMVVNSRSFGTIRYPRSTQENMAGRGKGGGGGGKKAEEEEKKDANKEEGEGKKSLFGGT